MKKNPYSLVDVNRVEDTERGTLLLTKTLRAISLKWDLKLYIVGLTRDTGNGANAVYTAQAVANWNFNGTGTVDPQAGGYPWTPTHGVAGITPPENWQALTDGMRPITSGDRGRPKMKNRYFIVFVFSCMTWPAFAALTTTTGKEWELWTRGRYVVVVAKVEGVVAQPRNRDGPTHELTLVPLSTLAGNFDPTEQQTLSAFLSAQTHGTLVHRAPPRGTTVIAVLKLGAVSGEQDSKNWVVPDICTFMPDHLSLVVIDGPGDPRVVQTLERLRTARANPNPSPYLGTSTRPASGATNQRGD